MRASRALSTGTNGITGDDARADDDELEDDDALAGAARQEMMFALLFCIKNSDSRGTSPPRVLQLVDDDDALADDEELAGAA